MNFRHYFIFLFVVIFSGCATYASLNFDDLFGSAKVRQRTELPNHPDSSYFLSEVKPILDKRCVVCHACYDAPCQLKLSSVEGIERGGSKKLVYEGTRLTATKPTRLFEDAQTTEEWRQNAFFPVLNEREQSLSANLDAGLIARMLTQKQRHPLPEVPQLEGFDFSIARQQVCPTIEEYADYERQNPTWGMPFGMPNLSDNEYNTLIGWVGSGATMNSPLPLTMEEQQLVDEYELLLNKSARKNQLTARYIYEHLFLSHLYFSEIEGQPRFFTLIRSATPPGQPVERIVTRRPYDPPGVDRVYYRLIPEQGTIVDKTHMPFALNERRLQQWYEWFIEPEYTVSDLPSYQIHVAANPMTAFTALPYRARFSFMLDNAQNTIMAYIKGPVCRGQLALNVINDHFWIFFIDPESSDIPEINQFYQEQTNNLKLPSELDSTTVPLTNWVAYSRQQARYLEARAQFMNKWFKDGQHLTTDILWKGNEENPNAALTIFRHFDSASVVQGMVGSKPKTAWILDYALLERIHYLLVAGFDVYGNFGHQLITRMFMDFLRMEGESNFLALLPNEVRHNEFSSWYKDQSPQFSAFLQRNVAPFSQPTQVKYKTNNHKSELFDIIRNEMAPILHDRYDIVNTGLSKSNEALLASINNISGDGLIAVPQIVMVMVKTNNGSQQLFTMLHDNAHTNISSLFAEERNRDFSNDGLSFVRGVIGSYPAAYFSLNEDQIHNFVSSLKNMNNEQDYIKLLDNYAVRRTSPEFWSFSDEVHAFYQRTQPIEFGLLDYNRFENR
ncbi:fatty acid cis/trans isomerase [Vibrio sp. ZSDZ34]|uniref:Fatty acid cis/trans isomerase n=1 Tax=Vibrio gelatinilyticus TaxID=2893468 RepID=A0A9X1WDJ6_9VIBR|nr:fatty acid cis/trans isomerase [Vibrio gelatinilyticus]MCJ2377198.1 fatty acid cis/trans isomerase [Vibrio gelatinilyticus]